MDKEENLRPGFMNAKGNNNLEALQKIREWDSH
jgi:hypothetical protein